MSLNVYFKRSQFLEIQEYAHQLIELSFIGEETVSPIIVTIESELLPNLRNTVFTINSLMDDTLDELFEYSKQLERNLIGNILNDLCIKAIEKQIHGYNEFADYTNYPLREEYHESDINQKAYACYIISSILICDFRCSLPTISLGYIRQHYLKYVK